MVESVVEKVSKYTGNLSSTPNYCNSCPSDLRGLCCYFSIYDGIDNFAVFPCKYLNKKTRRCTIYKNRFTINPDCLDIKQAYDTGALPEECPYVKGFDHPPIQPFKTINVKKRLEVIKKWKKKQLKN